jgi:hypothetical protein
MWMISVRKYKNSVNLRAKKNQPEAGRLCMIKTVSRFYALCLGSSETDSFLRPFLLLPDNMERPLAEDILSLNPCLFFLFLLDG